MILNILWMILIGLAAGGIAKVIVPGSAHLGWVATAVLGIAGGWVGGTLGSVIFSPHRLEITPPIKHSIIGARIGAVILLFVYRFVSNRNTRV